MSPHKSGWEPTRRDSAGHPPFEGGVITEVGVHGLVGRDLHAPNPISLTSRYDRRRRLIWSSSEGHVEFPESIRPAAVREVREETGIDAKIVNRLSVIDFPLRVSAKGIRKSVRDLLMMSTGDSLSHEDRDVESFACACWDRATGNLTQPNKRKLPDSARTSLLWDVSS